ncbi:immunity 50 family protein [Streptomyces sp. NBC_00390]|uniref:Imm50 family immunity protein n=1 Tax=Streptomyces sp. NBC_00390 TaxID=2975736 RepID=UPI002E1E5376
MNTSDWAALLAEPERVRDVFVTVPDLDECRLFYFHIDERDTSVTLGLDLRVDPRMLLPERGRRDTNAFEFFIVFNSVKDLRISGWGGVIDRSVTLLPCDDGGLAVSIEGAEEAIAFRAEGASFSRSRFYLASDSA